MNCFLVVLLGYKKQNQHQLTNQTKIPHIYLTYTQAKAWGLFGVPRGRMLILCDQENRKLIPYKHINAAIARELGIYQVIQVDKKKINLQRVFGPFWLLRNIHLKVK